MAHHPGPQPDAPPVRRRLVCYLSGFDPQGPAHYHRLFGEQGALQAAVGGYTLRVGPRRKGGEWLNHWQVHTEVDGQLTETRYEFLRWDDLVRQHWPRGPLGLLRSVAAGSWGMWRHGVMWQALKTAWPPFLAMALPGLLMAVGLAAGLAGLVAAVLWVQRGQAASAVALLAVLWPGMAVLSRHLEKRHHMSWLMRSVACLVKQGQGQTPELETRLDACAQHVAEAIRAGAYDEVLVVGHSSGAMQAMIVMARALRGVAPAATAGPASPTALGLLTLGHCTPLLSRQARAGAFRAELAELVAHPTLCWIDYTAPPDGCCFALSDPTAHCGVPGTPEQRPKLLNPRFARLFAAEAYRGVRGDKYRCHFQYLMAGQRPGSYDYFAITTGPRSLADRHAGLPSQTDFRQFQTLGGPR